MSLVRVLPVLPLFGLLFGLLFGAGAHAAEAGHPLRHYLPLFGKQIPLPAGDWQVAGSIRTVADGAGQTLPAPVATVVLVQVEAGTVTAFIMIHTNVSPARRGWGAAAACYRTGLYAAVPNAGTQGDVSCSFAARVSLAVPVGAMEPPSSPAWQGARALAVARGWNVPEGWLMAGARVGDREDFVDVRYHFDPGRRVLPATAPAAAAAAPVDALIRWRPVMAAAVESGFKNRLDDPGAADSVGERRRQALDGLLAQGRLSPAQYQEQLREATRPEDDAADNAAQMWMVAAKTVGWRVVVASSVALLSYAFTNSAVVAGGITGVTALVNGVLYFGHELFWKELDATAAEPPPVIDFAGAGITG